MLLTRAPFLWYVASSALWLAAMSLQGFLNTWLMIGELGLPADRFGVLHTLIAVPGVLLMLLGGSEADRRDPRTILLAAHLAIALPPLILAALVSTSALALWMVMGYAVFGSALQSFADPARSSALSLVARDDIQRGVSLSMGISSAVGIGGFYLGSHLESLGLPLVLMLQSLIFLAGGLCIRRVRLDAEPGGRAAGAGGPGARLRQIGAGLALCARLPILRAVISLSFVSSVFNAGAYIVVYPFVVREVYAGGAAMLGSLMMVFMGAATLSTLTLSLVVPLRHPGRLFMLMQLTRAAILGLLWLEPPVWGLAALTALWGANMGLTSTVARALIQENAPATHLARVLAVFTATFMVTSLVSPLLLGSLTAWFGPLDALLPGIAVSLAIFAIAACLTPLWHHDSGGRVGISHEAADKPPVTERRSARR